MAKINRVAGPTVDPGASAEAREGGVPPVVVDTAAPTPQAEEDGVDGTGDDPGPATAGSLGTEDEGPDTIPVRPPVNAPKAEHVAYAAARHGRDDQWWDDNYSKRDLIKTLDRLDAGEAVLVDDEVADALAALQADTFVDGEPIAEDPGDTLDDPSGLDVDLPDVEVPADFT